MSKSRPYVLSIAGFDPSSGAGITSDIKTFESLGVYGLGVITANTIQTDSKFESTNWISQEIFKKQTELILENYHLQYVKIGIIENLNVLRSIIALIKNIRPKIKIVWDPVIKATTGEVFQTNIEQDLLVEILKDIYCITPNLDEIEILLNEKPNSSIIKMLVNKTNCNLILKGGHSDSSKITDTLFAGDKTFEFSGEKFPGFKKHGTGCVYSSALISYLANGIELTKAFVESKKYVERFIKSNSTNLGYHI